MTNQQVLISETCLKSIKCFLSLSFASLERFFGSLIQDFDIAADFRRNNLLNCWLSLSKKEKKSREL